MCKSLILFILFYFARVSEQGKGTGVKLSTRLCSAFLSRDIVILPENGKSVEDLYWLSSSHYGGPFARYTTKELLNMAVDNKESEFYGEAGFITLLLTSKLNYKGDWKKFIRTEVKKVGFTPFRRVDARGVDILGFVSSIRGERSYAILTIATETQRHFLKTLFNVVPGLKLSIPAMAEGLEIRRYFTSPRSIPISHRFSLSFLQYEMNVLDTEKQKTDLDKGGMKFNNNPNPTVIKTKSNNINLSACTAAEELDILVAQYFKSESIEDLLKTPQIPQAPIEITRDSFQPTDTLEMILAKLPPITKEDWLGYGFEYWQNGSTIYILIIFDKGNKKHFALEEILNGGVRERALKNLGQMEWFNESKLPKQIFDFAHMETYPASRFAGVLASELLYTAGSLSNRNFNYIPGFAVSFQSQPFIMKQPMNATDWLNSLKTLFVPRLLNGVDTIQNYGVGVDFFEDVDNGKIHIVVVVIRDSELLKQILSCMGNRNISAKAVRVAIEANDSFDIQNSNRRPVLFDLLMIIMRRNKKFLLQHQGNGKLDINQVRTLTDAVKPNTKAILGKQKPQSEAFAFSAWTEENNVLVLAKVFDTEAENYESLEIITNSPSKSALSMSVD